MGSEKNTELYTHSPQECVEEKHKTTIIKENYYWYHKHRKGISRPITGTKKIMTQRRCVSHITCTSGDRRNVTRKSTRRM